MNPVCGMGETSGTKLVSEAFKHEGDELRSIRCGGEVGLITRDCAMNVFVEAGRDYDEGALRVVAPLPGHFPEHVLTPELLDGIVSELGIVGVDK